MALGTFLSRILTHSLKTPIFASTTLQRQACKRAKEPDSFRIGQSGSDLGPISRPKSSLEFPWGINNGLSVPLISNKLHRPPTLSRHFQEVLGIDGQPEECAVIIGNWFQRGGVVQLFSWLEPLTVTQDGAGSSPVAPAIHSKEPALISVKP